VLRLGLSGNLEGRYFLGVSAPSADNHLLETSLS